MFDVRVVLLIFAVALPGIVIAVPKTLKQLRSTIETRLPEGKSLPPTPVLIVVQLLQSIVLVGGLSAVGGVFAPKAGLSAPVFSALATGGNVVAVLPSVLEVFGLSLLGAGVFLALYYFVFRRRLDATTAQQWDRLRNQLGIGSRLLYGGIVEEVLMRWGLMSLLVWLVRLIPGVPEAVAVWSVIGVVGVLFGLGHAPSYLAAGCRKSPLFFTAMIVLNLWAGVLFGFLFWKYGLAAAMVSHMLFHLAWYPIDLATYRGEA